MIYTQREEKNGLNFSSLNDLHEVVYKLDLEKSPMHMVLVVTHFVPSTIETDNCKSYCYILASCE